MLENLRFIVETDKIQSMTKKSNKGLKKVIQTFFSSPKLGAKSPPMQPTWN